MCISTETLWRSCKPYTDWNDADFVLHPTLVNDHYVTINDGLVLAVHKDSVLGDFHCLNQHGLPADIYHRQLRIRFSYFDDPKIIGHQCA